MRELTNLLLILLLNIVASHGAPPVQDDDIDHQDDSAQMETVLESAPALLTCPRLPDDMGTQHQPMAQEPVVPQAVRKLSREEHVRFSRLERHL